MSIAVSSPAAKAGEHRFFSTMSVIAAAVILIGFGNVSVARLRSGEPLPTIVGVHAAVFTCWLALFIAQAVLVMRGKVRLHQKLGTWGVALAGLMLVVGVMVAMSSGRLGHRGIPGVTFKDAETFLLLNLTVTVVFGVLVAAAWWYRRKPQVHKRLMLMATVGGLMPPGISRVPGVYGHVPAIAVVVLGFLLVGPIHDLITRRRVHPAYITGFVVSVFAFPPVVETLSTIPVLHRMAQAMIG